MIRIFYFSILLVSLLLVGCEKEVKPEHGTIAVSSEPSGALVYNKGKKIGVTPATFRGSGGLSIKIEKDGYESQWHYVSLGIGENKKINARLVEDTGAILVSSSPDGANVILGDKSLGLTPLVITDLKVGKHEIIIEKTGRAKRSISFNITDSRPQELKVNLESNVGYLEINTVPERATVFINGKAVGYTPYKAELDEGRYQLRLEKAEFLNIEEQVVIKRDIKEAKIFEMSGKPGSIKVTSTPDGASVYIDDKLCGTTPLLVNDVNTGNRTIRVEKDGFDTIEESVVVATNSMTESVYMLNSSTGGIDLNVFPAGVTVYVNGKEHGIVDAGETALRPEMLRIRNLSPGAYQITVAHRRANPERITVVVPVEKGKVSRPRVIELWVPNAEVKWKKTGIVEIGVVFAETDDGVIFGSEKGVKISYSKDEFEYIKFLEDED